MASVLLIDDDFELCDLLQEYLTIECFEVEVCQNPKIGLERALSGQHTFIILDV